MQSQKISIIQNFGFLKITKNSKKTKMLLSCQRYSKICTNHRRRKTQKNDSVAQIIMRVNVVCNQCINTFFCVKYIFFIHKLFKGIVLTVSLIQLCSIHMHAAL